MIKPSQINNRRHQVTKRGLNQKVKSKLLTARILINCKKITWREPCRMLFRKIWDKN